MTAFLTINTVAYGVLAESSARNDASEFIGESARAFAGNLRTSRRAEKRTWTFQIYPLTTAQEITLRALLLAGFVTIGGEATNGVSVSVEGTITTSEYSDVGAGVTTERTATVQFREV